MINCVFYSLFFALFLNVSFGTLRYSQINRAFMSIYKGMIEASLLTVSDKGESISPYFDDSRLQSYINNYFAENISKFSKDYTVTTRYTLAGILTCRTNCKTVEITLNAKIGTFFDYNKTQVFTVKTNKTV